MKLKKPGQDKDLFRMIIVTIIIFCAMSALRPSLFLKPANFTSMGYQLPELGLYSLAFMVVLITGQFNLSIVATGNLCCIVGMMIMHPAVEAGITGAAVWGYIAVACIAMIATGVVCGLVNGIVVTYFNVPAMLVTMSTSTIFTGIAIIVTEGKALSGLPKEFTYFGNHTFAALPYAMWLLLFVFALTAVLLTRTKFGFELKFVGSNLKASHYSGINVDKVRIKAYVYSAFISSLCGIEILAHTNAAKADYASTYVGQAILCAVLGATAPGGGYSNMACMALSMLSLQFLSSGFTMLRLGGYFKELAWGVLLILVLGFDFFTQEMRRKKSIRDSVKQRKAEKN